MDRLNSLQQYDKKMDAIKKDYIPALDTPYHVDAFSYIYIYIYMYMPIRSFLYTYIYDINKRQEVILKELSNVE